MVDKLIGTNIEKEDVMVGTRDIHNLLYRMLQGYRFLHRNENPKLFVVPMITEVDGVPVEFKQVDIPVTTTIKETKNAKAK
jgi:hypothetical protein